MNGEEVVSTSSDAAFAVDSGGWMIAWNAAATDCLGYRRSEIVGRRCWGVLQGRDLAGCRVCGKNCAYMASQAEPVNRAQMLLRSLGQAEMLVRNAFGEATRVSIATFVVQGESGKREFVHIL